MTHRTRRKFLAEVGQGMLVASVGASLAADLGLAPAFAKDGPESLTFGDREPLVSLLQQTPAEKLLPVVVGKMKDGTDLKSLVAAAALANARTFGGQDYDGYHCFMALLPSLHMAQEMPKEKRALPVLKVLYRNTARMQAVGGHTREVMHPVAATELPKDHPGAEVLQQETRKHDIPAAEGTFAALVHNSVDDAFNDLLYSVQDEMNVHRVVLVWRSWATLELAGKEQAHTLLRQSVRFCCHEGNRGQPEIYTLLPKLLDQYKLMGKKVGKRKMDDAWVEKMAETIYGGGRAKAADAVAAALAEGISPEEIGEAMSLAANRLVLCDPGRTKADTSAKPIGSVHGASVGVHASDAANGWRNIARVSNTRNTFASMICGAYHTAGQNGGQLKEAYPSAALQAKVKAKDGAALLKEAEEAIKTGNQAMASALVHRYGGLKLPARPVFDLLLRYGVSEDGALHAEKYYRTVTEEFGTSREAFRWRQLVALARVTASEHGFPAPGYGEACRLLKV